MLSMLLVSVLCFAEHTLLDFTPLMTNVSARNASFFMIMS